MCKRTCVEMRRTPYLIQLNISEKNKREWGDVLRLVLRSAVVAVMAGRDAGGRVLLTAFTAEGGCAT